jgi:N-glycosylase/DNA lyase
MEYLRRRKFNRPTDEAEKKRIRKLGAFKRPVLMLDDSGKVIKKFSSCLEAREIYGNGLVNVLAGRAKTSCGYRWSYA